MCGICGIATTDGPVDEGRVEAMNATLVHRGPDDGGVHLDRGGGLFVGLGHRRLSIIDVHGGHQPLGNEDGSVQTIVNGEIYNFAELRRGLEDRGHTFRTDSDCETLVHLWEEEGVSMLARLVGMFALALWDRRAGRLLLARDRLGQKPLFYRPTPGGLTFASSLATLLVDAPPGAIDPLALDRYLALNYVPSPDTILAGIHKIPPAHFLVHEAGRTRVARYWWPRPSPDAPADPAEAAGRLRAALDESVRLRLVSDVPLGAFLSGGIDSSILVALMAGHSSRPVRTFSIGFDEADYDEAPFARLVAERYATEHHEMIVRPSAREIFDDLVLHYAEPFADSSAIPTWYVSKLARQHVTVALSGDGGDELFAGYTRYKGIALSAPLGAIVPRPAAALLASAADLCWRDRTRKTPAFRAAKLLGGLVDAPLARYLDWIGYFPRAERQALYRPEWAAALPPNAPLESFRRVLATHSAGGPVSRTLLLDLLTYLPEDLLTKVDVASMAHSLEVRAPFLDHRVVATALAIPTAWKLRGWRDKWILKRAFADLLPAAIRRRPKQGFAVPLGDWFRGQLVDLLELLLARDARIATVVRPAVVRRLVDDHLARRAVNEHRLWNLLFLEMWWRRFLG